jgi:glycosyltransferase involved in cell wall biosynthesis
MTLRPRGLIPAAVFRPPLPAIPAGRLPTVTVVITCFNYAGYIAGCIESVLTQTGVSVEVIVVDDHSTDGSAQTVAEIARREPRVRLYVNAQNMGPVHAFNRGVDAATGEYLVRLDADDLLTSGSLERAVALLEHCPSVGMVYGHPLHFEDGSVPRPTFALRGWTVWRGRDWLTERCRTGTNCITSPEVVMRMSVVAAVGGQRPELPQTHDMEMWMRLASVCDVGHVDGPHQALHREHSRSRSATMVGSPLKDLRERIAAFEVLFTAHDPTLDPNGELEKMARGALGASAVDRACRAYDRGRVATDPVDDYIGLALAVDPSITRRKEWRRYQARRRVGPRLAPLVPTFFFRAVMRRVGDVVARRRWERTGI